MDKDPNSQSIRPTVKYVLLIAISLIIIGFFLPGFGREPVPLETVLLVLSKYSVGIFHLVTVLALILSLLVNFKKGTYWVALVATLFSFFAQLIYSVECGLFMQIASGRAYGVLVLSIGQVLALAGLALYKVQAFLNSKF